MLCCFSRPGIIMSTEMEVKKTSTFLIWSILTVACLFDAKNYRIPNELIILGYCAGFVFNVTTYQSMGVVYFIGKAIWPILLLYLLFLARGIGAGDIKLFSVMSTMVGASDLIDTMMYSVMLAGIIAVIICFKERQIVKKNLHYSYFITAAFFLHQYI